MLQTEYKEQCMLNISLIILLSIVRFQNLDQF